MNSKILIDWNEVPMITVKLPVVDNRARASQAVIVDGVVDPYEVPYENLEDARDKLAHVFVNSGPFALIAGTDIGTYEIHSMNVLDVMQNILDMYWGSFSTKAALNEFVQSVHNVCSLLESATGERSTAFKDKVVAQALSNVSFNGEKQCSKCLADSVG